ncbi:hypothetical protein MRM75_12215 [bacterium 19CA06SA08-2]|uniref:Uncharacterized protein n=1 Tax=bacterium 19CA06SA08-2 TaxID=2920658 RepID=A0AAU6U0L7_UNCXX
MGRSIPVQIGQRKFASKAGAERYFMDQREAIKAAGPLAEGELFSELKELYIRFCDASPGWELNGRNILAFISDYERRQVGSQYVKTLCFKVKFSNDEVRPFSIREAITAITKAGTEADR